MCIRDRFSISRPRPSRWSVVLLDVWGCEAKSRLLKVYYAFWMIENAHPWFMSNSVSVPPVLICWSRIFFLILWYFHYSWRCLCVSQHKKNSASFKVMNPLVHLATTLKNSVHTATVNTNCLLYTSPHIDTDNKNYIKIHIKSQIFACEAAGNS